MSRILFLLFAGLLLSGCRTEGPVPDRNAERMKLLATDMEFSKKSQEAGAAEAFSLFADDSATQLPMNSLPVAGRENIYRRMKPRDSTYILTWTPQQGEVSASGDIGYTWGVYVIKPRPPLDTNDVSYGKYLTVWKRQPAGLWKWIADIGNENPPPSEKGSGSQE